MQPHNVLGLSMVTHELSVMKGCIKDRDMNVRVSVTARRLAIGRIVCLIFISWLSCCSGGLGVCLFALSLVRAQIIFRSIIRSSCQVHTTNLHSRPEITQFRD